MPPPDALCGSLGRVMSYRVQIDGTPYGTISAYVEEQASGYIGIISAQEFPDLPIHGPLPGEPYAQSVEEAVEQLRRALNRS